MTEIKTYIKIIHLMLAIIEKLKTNIWVAFDHCKGQHFSNFIFVNNLRKKKH